MNNRKVLYFLRLFSTFNFQARGERILRCRESKLAFKPTNTFHRAIYILLINAMPQNSRIRLYSWSTHDWITIGCFQIFRGSLWGWFVSSRPLLNSWNVVPFRGVLIARSALRQTGHRILLGVTQAGFFNNFLADKELMELGITKCKSLVSPITK